MMRDPIINNLLNKQNLLDGVFVRGSDSMLNILHDDVCILQSDSNTDYFPIKLNLGSLSFCKSKIVDLTIKNYIYLLRSLTQRYNVNSPVYDCSG